MAQGQRTTGWVGWIWFAAVMAVLIGAFNIIDGLVALFHDTLYVVAPNDLLVFDFTTWGWIHLVIGALQVIGGIALVGGRTWAQVLVCGLIMINAIAQLAFLPAFPVWSILVIALDVVTLYAIIVHGRELRPALRENVTEPPAGTSEGYSAGYTAGAAGGRHQARAPEPTPDVPVAGPRAEETRATREPQPPAG